MDAKLKTKWIKALRSGKYKQGKFLFKNEDSYCCLGVLCVVAGCRPMTLDGTSNWKFAREAAGGPDYGPGDHVMTCAHMNDEGKPFTEIADYIEANL